MTEKPRDPGLKFVGNSMVIALELELSLKNSSRKFHAPTALQNELTFLACSSALALAADLLSTGRAGVACLCESHYQNKRKLASERLRKALL